MKKENTKGQGMLIFNFGSAEACPKCGCEEFSRHYCEGGWQGELCCQTAEAREHLILTCAECEFRCIEWCKDNPTGSIHVQSV